MALTLANTTQRMASRSLREETTVLQGPPFQFVDGKKHAFAELCFIYRIWDVSTGKCAAFSEAGRFLALLT